MGTEEPAPDLLQTRIELVQANKTIADLRVQLESLQREIQLFQAAQRVDIRKDGTMTLQKGTLYLRIDGEVTQVLSQQLGQYEQGMNTYKICLMPSASYH